MNENKESAHFRQDANNSRIGYFFKDPLWVEKYHISEIMACNWRESRWVSWICLDFRNPLSSIFANSFTRNTFWALNYFFSVDQCLALTLPFFEYFINFPAIPFYCDGFARMQEFVMNGSKHWSPKVTKGFFKCSFRLWLFVMIQLDLAVVRNVVGSRRKYFFRHMFLCGQETFHFLMKKKKQAQNDLHGVRYQFIKYFLLI